MQIKKGIPVSQGVVIARALVVDAEDAPIPRRSVPPAKVKAEFVRLDQAIAKSVIDLKNERNLAEKRVGAELAKIFNVHAGMIQDQYLVGEIKAMMERESVSAEFAVYHVLRSQARLLQQQEDRVFRDRAGDIWDLERRILHHLLGTTRAELSHLKAEAVIVAHDLTPSQTASLDKDKVLAIATDAGGQTSHTAILAHALGIPAIVGLGDLSSQVSTGETIIIDGNRGLVILDPDAEHLLQYRQEIRRGEEMATTLEELARLPAVTRDGAEISLGANIEFPSEIGGALERGAVCVGLYRTEFLFLAADTEPTEEQQYEAYKQAIKALGGRPLTIRTLDLGADKLVTSLAPAKHEANPFLGCRSIRLCLQNLPLFKTQLRAILRASIEGPVRLMFPLICNIMELRQARMILNDVMEDLEEEGIAYRANIPVGIMIEVPSAAIQAKALARECDFFSIGTNDLIQYTVAVDRGNERIASLYSAAHPAVIQLIKDVVRAANRAGREVSLCGEMAGEPEYTMLLLGLGLRNMSLSPPAIPAVKRVIRAVSTDQCRRVARKAMSMDSDREVLNYLRDEVSRLVPEALDGRSIEY